MTARPRITVLGSINADLLVRCDSLPSPGETVLADSCTDVCGGKGANQAVAAARAGGDVTMIGRVGDDTAARRLLESLNREQIDCQWVGSTAGCASGRAVVAVERSGQNAILVVAGANAAVSVADVRLARSVIEASDVVLLQLEVPIETVLCAMEIAQSANVRVMLDPAPAPHDWPKQLLAVDLLCPNLLEAETLSRISADSAEMIERAARRFHRSGARNVAITLGEDGAALFDGRFLQQVHPFPVCAVDTTAAGDAFAGALAVRWAETNELLEAVRFGNAAGALAASGPGAQPAMPWRDDIDALCNR